MEKHHLASLRPTCFLHHILWSNVTWLLCEFICVSKWGFQAIQWVLCDISTDSGFTTELIISNSWYMVLWVSFGCVSLSKPIQDRLVFEPLHWTSGSCITFMPGPLSTRPSCLGHFSKLVMAKNTMLFKRYLWVWNTENRLGFETVIMATGKITKPLSTRRLFVPA